MSRLVSSLVRLIPPLLCPVIFWANPSISLVDMAVTPYVAITVLLTVLKTTAFEDLISILYFLQISSLQRIHASGLLPGYPLPMSSRYMVIFKLYFQLYAIWPAVTLYDHLYDVWSSSMQNVLLMNEMARRAAGLPFFQDFAARPIVR